MYNYSVDISNTSWNIFLSRITLNFCRFCRLSQSFQLVKSKKKRWNEDIKE